MNKPEVLAENMLRLVVILCAVLCVRIVADAYIEAHASDHCSPAVHERGERGD